MSETEQSIRLRNGVSVDVVANGGKSRMVFFNKPVRGLELTQEESTSLGHLLLKRKESPRPTETLRQLMIEGFFDEQKDLMAIRTRLTSHGLFLKPSLLNTLLAKLSSRKEIMRSGSPRKYRYQMP